MAALVDGTGEAIIGAEDLDFDRAAGDVYISAYDRRKEAMQLRSYGRADVQGGIYTISLAALARGDVTARKIIGQSQSNGDFRPHGFNLRTGSGQDDRLAVINRRYTENNQVIDSAPRIEVYSRKDSGHPWALQKAIPVGDPVCTPNDLAIAGSDRIFVTSDRGNCTGFSRLIEDAFGLARSQVFELLNGQFIPLNEPMAFANGVAVMRHTSGAMNGLAVAATRGDKISIFGVEPDGKISALPPKEVKLPGGPDNIYYGAQGSLYVAVHTNLFRYALFRSGSFGTERSPSEILKIRRDPIGRGWRFESIFRDDGHLISGATAAVAAGDNLVVAAGYDDHVVICDLVGTGR